MNYSILGTAINSTDYLAATRLIVKWAHTNDSRYVCIANVHSLMEARDSQEYYRIVNSADLTAPDGMPLVWMMRLKGERGQARIYGPTLMLHVLEAAARENISVGFYGSTYDVLSRLTERVHSKYPTLKVGFAYDPPFRGLSQEEDDEIIRRINASNVRILFVGLGCPKQERWMAAHRGTVTAVMLGVGAAFDFHAGVKSQAPIWIQQIGFEWLYRLAGEPRRLWRRYLYNNPRFIFLAVADLLGFLR